MTSMYMKEKLLRGRTLEALPLVLVLPAAGEREVRGDGLRLMPDFVIYHPSFLVFSPLLYQLFADWSFGPVGYFQNSKPLNTHCVPFRVLLAPPILWFATLERCSRWWTGVSIQFQLFVLSAFVHIISAARSRQFMEYPGWRWDCATMSAVFRNVGAYQFHVVALISKGCCMCFVP